ncbi:MAG: phosphoribosylanthranilate isomerase [Cloacibacterium sp.]|nr:phosphoribosylanthranilate isomerase [Cloacibacterium sp.]
MKNQEPKAKNLPLLKVCGLTQMKQIEKLISWNVDFLGFIFYEKSPRYVLKHLSLEEISEINHQGKVGVFVNECIEKIIEISEKANLNYIQLHGDEDDKFIKNLRKKINPKIQLIKVFRIGNKVPTIVPQPPEVDYLLFDTDSQAFGGTGKTFEWGFLNTLSIEKPYFLSGGISLENIENLNILDQKPFAVDINSKFETEAGIKDLQKIRLFLDIKF